MDRVRTIDEEETEEGLVNTQQTPSSDTIRWFDQLSRQDVPIAGGKGANLGELVRAGVDVPPGFVITSATFRRFLEETDIRDKIRDLVENLDVDNTEDLRAQSDNLRSMILSQSMPDSIRDAVRSAYSQLAGNVGVSDPFVAVRSSATAEDTAETSFAGMNETFLNINGPDQLVNSVKECWASLYGARVLFYRRKQNVPIEKMSIAVIVQVMVNSEKAGVMFTVNPSTGDPKLVVIEGAFGLGDAVVSGSVNPDHYEVNKDTLEIVSRSVAYKDFRTIRGADGGVVMQKLSPDQAKSPCLTDDEVRQIAQTGMRIESHYGKPQDIEWAIEGGRTYIVQTRPVTAVGGQAQSPQAQAQAGKREELVRGLPASPGMAAGTARILASIEESDRFRKGDILVTRMTAPDWVPLMRMAAAIVTDEGGTTAHAAIVSRELGIPCIVGTREGTKKIKDGEEITIDAKEGVVYRGIIEQAEKPRTEHFGQAQVTAQVPITGTKLYVNLGEPDMAEEVASMPVDGVGLLRAEFMVLSITNNVHPRKLMQEGRGEEFMDKLADGLRTFGEAFNPRPVVFRATDFRSNEYRNMEGGAEFEPNESNPMIGYRGAYRYINEEDLFNLELRALKKCREDYRLENLHLMIPFVRTLWEMARVKELVDAAGLMSPEPGGMELWVMAEVPSVVYRLADYAALGVTGISIGSNDLTQLVLGVDRDSEKVAPLFDERDEAVMDTMRQIIQGCRDLGLTSSICGQAPSVYPELTAKLVEWGATSISVNPDVVVRTRQIIASAEQHLLLEATHDRRMLPDIAA